jgi:SAM-dependent methyltransferase
MAEPVSRPQGQNAFEDAAIAARYGSWYEGRGKRADRLEKEVLRQLLDRLPGCRSLLEVGCGTGHFSRWFQGLGLRVVGLDLSWAMLLEGHRAGAVPVARGDASSLPHPDASFDAVAYVTTLEFLADRRRALSEALRVARRGLLLGAVNRRSRLGRRLTRKGGPIWSRARLLTVDELSDLVLAAAAGDRPRIVARTTLRPVGLGWANPVRGGFIGMAAVLELPREQELASRCVSLPR